LQAPTRRIVVESAGSCVIVCQSYIKIKSQWNIFIEII